MELNLGGKIAMVPGASRGLGYAIARKLAGEGAIVSISARGEDIFEAALRIETETGNRVMGWRVDVTDPDAIDDWVDRTITAFGGVDLLCVNSGGPVPGDFQDLDDAAWSQAFDLLLMSAVRLVRGVLPSMRLRGGGSILFLTSSAVKEPLPNLTLSNVVRASVAALSKSLALQLACDSIRVNQLIPGRILTQRVVNLDAANASRLGISTEAQRERSMASIPMGRYGDPEEFANAAAVLLSDAASYVTGASLQVDGGLIKCAG